MSDRRGGGRRGGGGGNREPLPRSVQISKKLSWLLRHGAEEEGLQLGEGGFINLQDVLNNRKIRGLKATLEEVREIVQDNDKQRFTLRSATSDEGKQEEGVENESLQSAGQQAPLPSSNPADYLIRANQGHSLKVEADGLLQPITQDDLPDIVVHGTTHAAWPLIVAAGGLKPMKRNHVHFARGLPAGIKSVVDDGETTAGVQAATTTTVAAPVISGMRTTSTILIFVDIGKAIGAGMKFWTSDNGVILSAGDEEAGVVPLGCFKRVEDRTGEGVLVEDGVVIKEAPAQWGRKKR